MQTLWLSGTWHHNPDWECQVLKSKENPEGHLVTTNLKTGEIRRYKHEPGWNGIAGMMDPESIQGLYEVWNEEAQQWTLLA